MELRTLGPVVPSPSISNQLPWSITALGAGSFMYHAGFGSVGQGTDGKQYHYYVPPAVARPYNFARVTRSAAISAN